MLCVTLLIQIVPADIGIYIYLLHVIYGQIRT